MAALSAQLVGIDPGNTAYDGDLQRPGRSHHQQPQSALSRRIAKLPRSAAGRPTRRPQYLFIANQRRPHLFYEVFELRASYATKAVPVKPNTTMKLSTASQAPTARLGAQAPRVPEPRKAPPPPSPFSSPGKRVIRRGPPKLGTSTMNTQIEKYKEKETVRAAAKAADELKSSASCTAPYRRPGNAAFAGLPSITHTSATTKSADPSLVGKLKVLPRTSPSIRSNESTTSAEYDKEPALNAVESVKMGSVLDSRSASAIHSPLPVQSPLRTAPAAAAKSAVKVMPKPKQVSKQDSKNKASVSSKGAARPDTTSKKTPATEVQVLDAISAIDVQQPWAVMPALQSQYIRETRDELVRGNPNLVGDWLRQIDLAKKEAARKLLEKEKREKKAEEQRMEEERIQAEDQRLEQAIKREMERENYVSWRLLMNRTVNVRAKEAVEAIWNILSYHKRCLSRLEKLMASLTSTAESSVFSSVDSFLASVEDERFQDLRKRRSSPAFAALPSASPLFDSVLESVKSRCSRWEERFQKHKTSQEECSATAHESRRFARLGRYYRGRLDHWKRRRRIAQFLFTQNFDGWKSIKKGFSSEELLYGSIKYKLIMYELRMACQDALIWESDITGPDGFLDRVEVYTVMKGSLLDQELFRACFPLRQYSSDLNRKTLLATALKEYIESNWMSDRKEVQGIVSRAVTLERVWFASRDLISEVEGEIEKVVTYKARYGQLDPESLRKWLSGIAYQMLDRDTQNKKFAMDREKERLDEVWRKKKGERRKIKGTSPQQSFSTTPQIRHYFGRDRAEPGSNTYTKRFSFDVDNSAAVSTKDQSSVRRASSSKKKKADKMPTEGQSSAQPSAIGQGKSKWAKKRRAARLAQEAVGTAAAYKSSNVDNAATIPTKEQPSVQTASSSKEKEAGKLPTEGHPSAQPRPVRKNPQRRARKKRRAARLARESTLPDNKSETSALAAKRDGTPPVEQLETAPDGKVDIRVRKVLYPLTTGEMKESVDARQGIAAIEQSEGAPGGKVGSSKLSRNALPRDTAEANAASPAVRSKSTVPQTGLKFSPSKRLQRHMEVPSDVDGSLEVSTQLLRQDALSDPGYEKGWKICRMRSSADESHRQCCRDMFIGSQVELDVVGISKAGWLGVWASKVALGALGFASSSASASSRHGSDRDSAPSGHDGFDAPGSLGTAGPSRSSASSSSSSDSLSSAGPSEEASDADSPSEDHVSLSYRLPEQTLAAAIAASQNGEIVFWSHDMYRGPNEEKVLVHYCRRVEDSERVAKLFLKEQVLGFDIEWKPHFRTGHGIKNNVSLIQLASQSRIALFHIALHKGKTREELLAPALRDVIESPNITKAGVSIKADCTRLRKFLGIEAQSIFELSHLYKVVKYSTFEKRLIDKRLVSLAQQVEEHLQLPLDKGPVRESDWTKALTYQQRTYAASDSYAAVILFNVMERKRKALRPTPPRPTHAELNLPILLLGEGAVGSAEAPGMVNVDYEETPLLTPDDHRSIVNSTLGKHSGAELAEPQRADGLVRPSDQPGSIRSGSEQSGEATDVGSVAQAMAELSMSSGHNIEPATSHANPTTPLSLANSWVSEYLSRRGRLPGGPRPSASAANLRAYDLWHNQQWDVYSTAAFLRDPPLQPSTAAMYILDALALEGLPYEEERAITLFPFVSGKMLQTRYKSIRDEVGG